MDIFIVTEVEDVFSGLAHQWVETDREDALVSALNFFVDGLNNEEAYEFGYDDAIAEVQSWLAPALEAINAGDTPEEFVSSDKFVTIIFDPQYEPDTLCRINDKHSGRVIYVNKHTLENC